MAPLSFIVFRAVSLVNLLALVILKKNLRVVKKVLKSAKQEWFVHF